MHPQKNVDKDTKSQFWHYLHNTISKHHTNHQELLTTGIEVNGTIGRLTKFNKSININLSGNYSPAASPSPGNGLHLS